MEKRRATSFYIKKSLTGRKFKLKSSHARIRHAVTKQRKRKRLLGKGNCREATQIKKAPLCKGSCHSFAVTEGLFNNYAGCVHTDFHS